jgi:hypothetical protein
LTATLNISPTHLVKVLTMSPKTFTSSGLLIIMSERIQFSLGGGLLVITSAIVLGYAFVGIPVVMVILATIGMSMGTLLVGTANGTV